MSETERERILYGMACGFCTALRLELSGTEFNHLSRGKDDLGANDYCDANVLMLEAWATVMRQEIFDPCNSQDAALWNDAWDIAVRHRYNMSSYCVVRVPQESTVPAPVVGEAAGDKETSDLAGELAIAKGLFDYLADKDDFDISEAYQGVDECMRRCMHLGRVFEVWACDHIHFDSLQNVWPYYLEDHIGPAIEKMFWEANHTIPIMWDDSDLLSLAVNLRLPVLIAETTGSSMDIVWELPRSRPGEFQAYQVRTVRTTPDGESVEHYSIGDAAHYNNDDNHSPILFALYGSLDAEDPVWEFVFEMPSYEALRITAQRLLGADKTSAMPMTPVMRYPGESQA